MICSRGKEIMALQSGAGWYMGTLDDGMPNCRVTAHYYRTREAAEKNFLTDIRTAPENLFCSQGMGCCFKEEEENEDDSEE